MGIRTGQSVAQHNLDANAHSNNGLTALANCYVANSGRFGWSDSYFYRYSAGYIKTNSELMIESGCKLALGDARLKYMVANALGTDYGDCLILPCNQVSEGVYIRKYLDNLGSDIWHSNDVIRTTPNTSMTKLKESKINYIPEANLRIYFELRNGIGDATVYAQIYRNDVAVGTLRSTTGTSWQAFTEVISGWSNGDFLQIYGYTSNASQAVEVRNLRILCTLREDEIVAVS